MLLWGDVNNWNELFNSLVTLIRSPTFLRCTMGCMNLHVKSAARQTRCLRNHRDQPKVVVILLKHIVKTL
jgi:hypothetical protein